MATEHIRLLQLSDIPFAQRVRKIAGWNQTDADWDRLIRFEPEGCFLIECEGTPAGTATTTVHHDEVGWIGMVLVHPDFRRRGLATNLLNECINYLKPRTKSIKLDATPAGMLVYEKLGFAEETRLHRWEGKGTASARPEGGGSELPLELDKLAFGADRSEFLMRLAQSSEVHTRSDRDGYGMIRKGINASYLGSVVARVPKVGREIVEALLSQANDAAVYWDILDENLPAMKLAEKRGFERQRELIRMRLGAKGFEGDLSRQWAITGPETG
ncbi:GNAT family N-acetyltransferase [Verrucomicrobiales bacterium]|nr:GNAT family N-acetyltransferase [Verrucomicrobiales bacterium]